MFAGWIVRHTLKNFLGRGEDIRRHYLMITDDPAEAVRLVRDSGTVCAGDPVELIAPQFA